MLLIVSPNFYGDVRRIFCAAQSLGWKTYKPSGWAMPENIKGRNGVVYGEQLFCESVAEQMGWALRSNKLDWVSTIPERYSRRLVMYMPTKTARSMQTPKFIQPADMRSFEPQIFKAGIYLPPSTQIDDQPVLVSDVMSFHSKYKAFIKDRKVVAEACTEMNGKLVSEDKLHYNSGKVIRFVNDFLKDDKIECQPGTVISVGILSNNEMAVIGSKPAWKSSIGRCEMAGVLEVLKDSVASEACALATSAAISEKAS